MLPVLEYAFFSTTIPAIHWYKTLFCFDCRPISWAKCEWHLLCTLRRIQLAFFVYDIALENWFLKNSEITEAREQTMTSLGVISWRLLSWPVSKFIFPLAPARTGSLLWSLIVRRICIGVLVQAVYCFTQHWNSKQLLGYAQHLPESIGYSVPR